MSKTVKMDLFLAKIQEIISEKPTYKLGKDGSNGLCDCIGLIIGAIRRAGGEWRGTHGSNYAARNEMQTLESSPHLEIGMVMYKYFAPGEAGWNLPAAYANDPDQNDYYHVGVVLSVSPLKIVHCTSWSGGSGIKFDTVIGKWRKGGRLKKVDYSNKEEHVQDLTVYTSPDGTVEMEPLVVTVTGGGTARMRKKPDTNALILSNIRDGVYVQGIRRGEDGWYQIKYNGKIGWMMEQYLRVDGEASPGDSDPPDVVDVDREALWAELEWLNKRQGIIIAALKGVV